MVTRFNFLDVINRDGKTGQQRFGNSDLFIEHLEI